MYRLHTLSGAGSLYRLSHLTWLQLIGAVVAIGYACIASLFENESFRQSLWDLSVSIVVSLS